MGPMEPKDYTTAAGRVRAEAAAGGRYPFSSRTTFVIDPADRLTPEFLAALRDRYAGAAPPLVLDSGDGAAERYAAVCDLVVQLLWPEAYGTGPGDPAMHTSDPARVIASLFFAAAGLAIDVGPPADPALRLAEDLTDAFGPWQDRATPAERADHDEADS